MNVVFDYDGGGACLCVPAGKLIVETCLQRQNARKLHYHRTSISIGSLRVGDTVRVPMFNVHYAPPNMSSDELHFSDALSDFFCA